MKGFGIKQSGVLKMSNENRYKQKVFDTLMCLPEGVGLDCFYDDLLKIIDIINFKFKIKISPRDSLRFWTWRSEKYDASFLFVNNPDEVCTWFIEWLDHLEYNDIEEQMKEGDLL